MTFDATVRIGVMAHITDHTVTAAELAVEAEHRGYDAVFVTEHTHVPVQSFIAWRDGQAMPDQYKRLHDPLIGLATAASVTTRLRLGTGVLVISQREPIATAKQLASLDRLSGGRLILGTGYGWLRTELNQHGVSWADRRNVWREHLCAMRALWKNDEGSFEGARVRFGPTWSYPKPAQANVPVWLGSGAHRSAFEDIVDLCDGWIPVEGTEPINRHWIDLRHVAETRGRDPDTLTLAVFGSAGNPRQLDVYQSLGARHAIIGVDASNRSAMERQLDHHQYLIERYT